MGVKTYGPEGRTYSVDIRLIMEKFPVSQLKEGELISYKEIEKILDINHKSNRYKGVVSAWRNKMRNEYNKYIGSVRGEGFKLLDPHDRVSYSYGFLASGIKKLETAYECAETTDISRLDEEDLQRRRRLLNNLSSRLIAEKQEQKQLGYIIKTLESNKKDNNDKTNNGGKK